ncbi:conserved hypothetical protein [Leishmania mexicana MHOM/GT/2001/U1103]|uniref:Uncharacterized protein n=1 Tax=Leishmania mexicana (strain MHOM/GT/2001/U1103) TaxID=929439 RepID=E9AWJ3_LEIMU|nr:conserved hypothetical protein [Leishmania mexicana MHOM/GT/2001/U1103]CBZ27329.1 conserved hypothetical protein [Leishmania mexicana MHOM/GT/2001/U1103]
MRVFCLRSLAALPAGLAARFYGGQGGARPPVGGRYARGGGPPYPDRRNAPTEPQIVARLITCFPRIKTFVPISRWAATLPDDLREALVPYGGLGAFASAQSNFFMIRKENGVPVASLSAMGAELAMEHERKEKQEQKRAEKFSQRKDNFSPRGRSFSPSRGGPPRK